MSEECLRIGGYALSNDSNDSAVALYVREERKIVEGSALIFNATGPHNLRMEIHYIQLENGNKWVVGGRAFNGPMWVFGQLNNRLKISVIQKEQGYSMDLTNPTPSKKNPEKYTTSMTTIKELSGIYPNIFNLLQENGVKEIDLRSNILNDVSNRKKFYTCLMDDADCRAPVLIYFLTRTVALMKEYEKLLEEGKVNSEQVSHYAEYRFKGSETGVEDLSRVDSLVKNMKNGDFEDEDNDLEYKPSWSTKREDKNPKDSIDVVMMEIASMLNTDGGLVLCGILDAANTDSGNFEVCGIDWEIKESKSEDYYRQHISNSLTQVFGTGVVSNYIRIDFRKVKGKTVLIFDVTASYNEQCELKPLGPKLKNKLNLMQADRGIWTRVKDSSRLLAGPDLIKWYKGRFTPMSEPV